MSFYVYLSIAIGAIGGVNLGLGSMEAFLMCASVQFLVCVDAMAYKSGAE